jgi:DNA-directed RNA polymerase specialized sigma24 family protein
MAKMPKGRNKMANHSFDRYSMQKWLAGLERVNEDEVMVALGELPARMQDIVISHVIERKTFRAIAKEHGISHQRAHQLFHEGIREIRKKVGR